MSQAAPMPSAPVAFEVPAGACDCHVHVILWGTDWPHPDAGRRDAGRRTAVTPYLPLDEEAAPLYYLSMDKLEAAAR